MKVASDKLALNLALSVVIIGLLVAMPLIPSAVEAQSPPLVVSKSASPDPVVAGDELTYMITLTNTGRVPLTGVVVTDTVPKHTTFVLVSGQGGNWWMQTPPLGGRGEITWKLDGPLAPDQVSHLRFVVQAETTNAEPIGSQGCRVMAEGWDAIGSEAVTTQVLLPTPTPTPLPTPVPAMATPAPTPTPVPPPTARLSPTFLPTSLKDNTVQPSSSRLPPGWAGLLIGLVVIAAALVPFTMQRARKQRTAQ